MMAYSPRFAQESFIPVGNHFPHSSRGRYREGRDNQNRHGHFEVPRARLEQAIPFNFDPPWKSRPYTCGAIGLHEEILDFYEFLRPTEEESELRLKVVEHITKVVHSLWPQARVEVFGSFRTGLYLPSSDIDLVISGEWRNVPLSTLSNALTKHGVKESDINIVANATIPLVKVLHTPSQVKLDISFNTSNGIKTAKLLKKLIKEYPVLPPLVFVLKQFLVQRNLNEVYSGGMSSYCLTLLIVSLLQGNHKPTTSPSLNLGTLMLEFFELYGINFNYEKVSIHLRDGGSYQPKVYGPNLLHVEDPILAGHDVAKGTYLMNLLRIAFENAYHVLSQAVLKSSVNSGSPASFLGEIIRIDDAVLEKRELMKHKHSNIMRNISALLENINFSSSSCMTEKKSTSIQSIKRKR